MPAKEYIKMKTLKQLLAELEEDGADKAAITKQIEALAAGDPDAEHAMDTLKTKNSELNKLIAKLKKNQLPDDFDPEKYQELLTAQEQAAEDKLKAAEKWDELKENMVKAHQEALTKKDERIDSLLNTIKSSKLDGVITSAISDEKGNVALLSPHVRNNMKVVEDDDGNFTTVVVDGTGEPRIDTTTGKPFTVNQLLGEMKEQNTYMPAFMDMSSGGGSGGGGNGHDKNVNPFKKGSDHYSLDAQVKIRREDPELAKQLMDAAVATNH